MKRTRKYFYSGVACACVVLFSFFFIKFKFDGKQETENLASREQHSEPWHPHDTHTHQAPNPVTDKSDQNEAENGSPASQSMGLRKAFKPALELRDTDPELASMKLHEIAKELGKGDPKWTEFYHLLGHSVFERPPGAPEGAMVLTLEDAARYYVLKDELIGLSEEDKRDAKGLQAGLRWNKEGQEVGHQTQPIRDLLAWMEENAPAEWEVVNAHFWETLPSRNTPKMPLSENWRTVEERVSIQYDTFFEAIDLLQEDALTLQTLYESSFDVAQQTLSSERMVLEVEPPAIDAQEVPSHTWDVVHEIPIEVDDILSDGSELSPKSPEIVVSEIGSEIDFEVEIPTTENFENTLREQFSGERYKQAMSTLTQYGPKEGLRRLKNDDPELASHLEKRLQK